LISVLLFYNPQVRQQAISDDETGLITNPSAYIRDIRAQLSMSRFPSGSMVRDVLFKVLAEAQSQVLAVQASQLLMDVTALHGIDNSTGPGLPWGADIVTNDGDDGEDEDDLGWNLLYCSLEGLTGGDSCTFDVIADSPCRPLNCLLIARYMLAVLEQSRDRSDDSRCSILDRIFKAANDKGRCVDLIGKLLCRHLRDEAPEGVAMLQRLIGLMVVNSADSPADVADGLSKAVSTQWRGLDLLYKEELLHSCVSHEFRVSLVRAPYFVLLDPFSPSFSRPPSPFLLSGNSLPFLFSFFLCVVPCSFSFPVWFGWRATCRTQQVCGKCAVRWFHNSRKRTCVCTAGQGCVGQFKLSELGAIGSRRRWKDTVAAYAAQPLLPYVPATNGR
jgi:hypothetical protein